MDPENPNSKFKKCLSLCCAASINIIPACFGDPIIQLCSNCSSHCEAVPVSIWEKVGQGTYRKIKYTKEMLLPLLQQYILENTIKD
jgi:hypothetical protein